MRIDFYLRFRTQFGQTLAVSGNTTALGNNDESKALPLAFFNENFWHASIEIDPTGETEVKYHYLFTNEKGETKKEAERDRVIAVKNNEDGVYLIDTWNDESFVENIFFSTPFKEVFFKQLPKGKNKKGQAGTHQFRAKAPLLKEHEVVCISGSADVLNIWLAEQPVMMQPNDNWWIADADFSGTSFPVSYKYGVYNTKKESLVYFEQGDNRVLHQDAPAGTQTILHDGFVRIPNTTWKGAGIAIPVFSLRSKNSFGTGEFADIKLLVDWAKETGLKLIQLLPVNDTSATFTWKDSYPYAGISAFALHPIYINLQQVAGKKNESIIRSLQKKQKQLNALPELAYEQVIHFKMNLLRELYDTEGTAFTKEKAFEHFFDDNKFWLIPYAAFCFLRDKNGTADFSVWKTNAVYSKEEIEKITSPRSKNFKHIAFFYFVQFHLHQQLKEATDYAHKKGIAVKGDIPIGIYRYGADAWTAPALFNMNMQAGAPPDDFAVKGQNWGFPTYNWKKMEEDHFEWWRKRFHQMSNYFDAFRIDHILGFFRIWSIPINAIDGLMGRFIPAVPVTVNEFGEQSIWFDRDRFCKPYITDEILQQVFGAQASFVQNNFVQPNNREGYDLKPEFDTQRKVADWFALQDEDNQSEKLREGLFQLIANVLLFEEEDSNGQQFHFRIAIENTSSFQHLDDTVKHKIRELYINYFYRRQDEFWKGEAMKKLPALKAATQMLICGEDLGMVPHSVPEVMRQTGILSLEIQRMPKNPHTEFFHPKDAPYLSVITPSSHDMSTVRAWWEEDYEKTQRFYNSILVEGGQAPYFCEAWINRAIVLQHLYSPAMWAVFQLQDLLGMSETLRRENPKEERINEPANPTHFWNYRMHISLEDLLKEKEFSSEVADYVKNSGRGV